MRHWSRLEGNEFSMGAATGQTRRAQNDPLTTQPE